MFMCLRFCVIFGIFILNIQASSTPSLIGHFGKWQAYTGTEEGKKICYATTTPYKSEGSSKSRGEAYIIITHRPYLKSTYSISVDLGYKIDVKKKVKITIDQKIFEIDLIQNETAWASTAEKDITISKAMMGAKRNITIHAKPHNAKPTQDIYPIKGVAAALKAISKECGIKDCDISK